MCIWEPDFRRWKICRIDIHRNYFYYGHFVFINIFKILHYILYSILAPFVYISEIFNFIYLLKFKYPNSILPYVHFYEWYVLKGITILHFETIWISHSEVKFINIHVSCVQCIIVQCLSISFEYQFVNNFVSKSRYHN